VPKLEPIHVMWVTTAPDPFTTLALSTLAIDSDIRVSQGAPNSWPPKQKMDVVIFDNWLPNEWPKDIPVVVLNPTKTLGPVQVARIKGEGLPVEDIRAANSSHPLLYGVATGRVSLTQTAVIESNGALQPLWVGSQGPILMAGEAGGQRVSVMAFSPQKSEQLPLMASYPLLIGNAIYWAAEKSISAARGLNHKTGDLISITGSEIRWQGVDEENETTVSVANRLVELDQIGLWQTDDGDRGSAALLSPVESTLTISGDKPMKRVQDAARSSSWLRGDLAPLLMWCVLGLLVLESWMYHRYVAY